MFGIANSSTTSEMPCVELTVLGLSTIFLESFSSLQNQGKTDK